MGTQSLATKYRPHRFEDVVEQDVTKDILLDKLKNKTFSHCLLFCGGAGTGKTTSGRIFAQEINDFKGTVTEIDAASNNGVEHIRRIIEEARSQPLDSDYKVILLDEVHMLSKAAWNAFLKLLEEPPKTCVFIMCTTDPQTIPATIMSRVQRYDFQKISQEGIIGRLKFIIDSENKEKSSNSEELITFEDSAIEFIAKRADGGMRDSITLLDKSLGYSNHLTLPNVLKALGSVSYETMFDLSDALLYMQSDKVIEIVEGVHGSGMDIKYFIKQYLFFITDVCKYRLFNNFKYLQIPSIYESRLRNYKDDDFVVFNQFLNELLSLNNNLKWETTPKQLVEATLLQLCTVEEG